MSDKSKGGGKDSVLGDKEKFGATDADEKTEAHGRGH